MTEQMQPTEGSAKGMYGKRLDNVHCLLIPVFGESLLLPNAAVAEVVAYTDAESASNTPEWFMGYINWREARIPLISFEAATGGEVAPLQKNSRIAVFNTLNRNQQLTHFGIVTQGIPRLRVVQEKQLERDEQPADPRSSIADYIMLDNETVLVPDLDDLERRILQLHVS